MRFSVRWLKQYLETDVPVPKLIDALTQAGLEVEEVVDLGMISGLLVVGEILQIDPIEGADKIRLTTIKADEPEPLKIVCGAWNIEPGQKIPVSKFGFTFPDGFVLKPRKIKGIEGQGMLCSPKELGVSDDALGIWILPDDAPVGEPWDAIVEIAITPNRPDALSMIGIARDLAAKIPAMVEGAKTSLRMPVLSVPESEVRTESVARVTVENKTDCPRYTARVVKDVEIKPSPPWMQTVLQSAGLRPINNIVDITNYVLLEMGHPLHAFDLHRLSGQHIIVRNPKPGEKIQTLDEETHDLVSEDLLICDAQKPVALAGVMGGANSEINEGTKDILIESAYFRPQTIRKTSKRLDKSTDSSYRFERGTDARKIGAALNRCAQLVAQLAGGRVTKGIIDVMGKLPEVDPILIRIADVNNALGMKLTGREITNVLTALGFGIQRADREEMLVEVPSHRVDVSIEADIIEEIARIIGYDRVPESALALPANYHPLEPVDALREKLEDAAAALGYYQAVNYSFTSPEQNALVGAEDKRQVGVQNPIVAEQSVMRRSMLPTLLQNTIYNLNRGVDDIMLFEAGHTYAFESEEPEEREERELNPPADEVPYLAGVLGGAHRNWKTGEVPHDFFTLKGHVQYLLNAVGLQKLVVEPASDASFLHPGRGARFLVKGHPVALYGEVHPALLGELDIKKPVYYFEIPLAGPIVSADKAPQYTEIPRYPAVTRDIALVVDKPVRSLELERTIKKAGGELLTSVKVFDVYEGEHVEKGKKSLAFSLTYRAPDRTLKEEEVNERHQQVLDSLEKTTGATLRS